MKIVGTELWTIKDVGNALYDLMKTATDIILTRNPKGNWTKYGLEYEAKLHDHGNGVHVKLGPRRRIDIDYSEAWEMYVLLRENLRSSHLPEDRYTRRKKK